MTDAQSNGSTTIELTETQAAYITGLRNLADFLTEWPHFTPDHAISGLDYFVRPEEMVERAREIGGEWEQQVSHQWVKLTRRFGPHEVYLYTEAKLVGATVTVMEPVTKFRVPDLLAVDPPVTSAEDAAWTERERERGWRESEGSDA